MGSILITQEGIETSTIDEDKRDASLFNFYMMRGEALKVGDCFFMTKETCEHEYSYGLFYQDFVNLSWDQFKKKDSLKGIHFNTYNAIANSFQSFYPRDIDEREFQQQNKPIGKGGFEHLDSSKDFLCNISNWKKWHQDYLTTHPNEIQWKSNSHLSNIEAVYDILEEEVLIYIKGKYKERINKANDTEQEIKKIWNELFADKKYHKKEDISQSIKQNAVALLFHKVVMTSKDHKEMTAYCKEIGKKVCEQNYYQYDKKLSTNEQKDCGSLREIYVIMKDGKNQYISLDFHKGMFEFHDEKGIHLGEYLFDGTPNEEAKKSHNLRTL